MNLYKLNDTVLRIKGKASSFLNGLTTNSLDRPFNAFVNQHGRIVATFFQHKISDDEFLIAVPSATVEALQKHLYMYAKISHATIEPADLNLYVDIDSGEWLIAEPNKASSVSNDTFTQYRLKNNHALFGIDYQADEFILNVDHGQFVSFTKGCFLGQEPVSKVHNRSKPTKKLIVKKASECTEEEKPLMTSKVKDSATGELGGFVFVKNS